MLRTRALTAIILVPIVIYCVCVGDLTFLALMTLLLTLAEIEFVGMMSRVGFRPTLVFGLGLVWVFLADAYFPGLAMLRPGMTLLILGSLAWQLFHRQGSPVADWALTVVGGLYLGLCGACLIGLRNLPHGLWWTLTVIPSIMIADTGAYFAGGTWGRRKLAPTLSPGKTWEGYLAGVVSGGLLTGLLAWLWQWGAGEGVPIGIGHGLVLGVLIATLAPFGDLAVSMIKRRANVKDSGSIIPGHGGALDRVDSILWAAVIGYYYVLFVVGG
ncbi:MAG TPA: CDP-archaeol synthase [Chloroflexi bacterium]|nr:CDP-archaeol synthase [Chloroflexota bacterium]